MATRGRKATAPALSAWVRDRTNALIDNGGDANAPDIADGLVNEVPMMLVVSDARAMIHRYVGATLRARYTASIPQDDGTVRYVQARLMGWDDLILSVAESIALGRANYAAGARKAEEWLEANPEDTHTVSDIIAEAEVKYAERLPE